MNKTFDFNKSMNCYVVGLLVGGILAFFLALAGAFPANAQTLPPDLKCDTEECEVEEAAEAYELLGQAAYARTAAFNRVADYLSATTQATLDFKEAKAADQLVTNRLKALQTALDAVDADSEAGKALATAIESAKAEVETSTLAVADAKRAEEEAKEALQTAQEELEEANTQLLLTQTNVMIAMFGHVIDEMTLAAELMVVAEHELDEAHELGDAAAAERNVAEELLLDHCQRNPDNQVCLTDEFKLIAENREKHDE